MINWKHWPEIKWTGHGERMMTLNKAAQLRTSPKNAKPAFVTWTDSNRTYPENQIGAYVIIRGNRYREVDGTDAEYNVVGPTVTFAGMERQVQARISEGTAKSLEDATERPPNIR